MGARKSSLWGGTARPSVVRRTQEGFREMLVNRLHLTDEPANRARTRYLNLAGEREIRQLYAAGAPTSRLFNTLWMGLAESFARKRQREIGAAVQFSWHPAVGVLEPFAVEDRGGQVHTLGTRHPRADDFEVRGLLRSLPNPQVLEVQYPFDTSDFISEEAGLDLLTRNDGQEGDLKLNLTTNSSSLDMLSEAKRAGRHVLRIPSPALMEGWARLSLRGAAEVYRLCPAAGRVSLHDFAALGVAGYVPVGLDVAPLEPVQGGDRLHPLEAGMNDVSLWYSNLLSSPLWFLDAETALGSAAVTTGIEDNRLFRTLVLKDDRDLYEPRAPSYFSQSYTHLSAGERDLRISLFWYLEAIPRGERKKRGRQLVDRFDDLLAELPRRRRSPEIVALRGDLTGLRSHLDKLRT